MGVLSYRHLFFDDLDLGNRVVNAVARRSVLADFKYGRTARTEVVDLVRLLVGYHRAE
jgi:hypothetical protein